MIEKIELTWLGESSTFKEALKAVLGSSGQLIKKYFSSKEQDRLIRNKDVIKLPLSFVNHLKINPQYNGPETRFISDSTDYLVVHKPPGIHCHPLSYEDDNTLLNFLVVQNKWRPLWVNQANYDRGLLYRLDFETSGVMVLANNEDVLKSVRENFNTVMKKKYYWAIVEGDFNQEGHWTHYLKPFGPGGEVQKVYDHLVQGSQEAHLSVLKMMGQNGKSLVLVSLKTGLRHQIRAQLSHLGFPIVGDVLYGASPAQRLFLHAFRYEFSQIVEDLEAELFDIFFDLNSALQMGHDMIGRI